MAFTQEIAGVVPIFVLGFFYRFQVVRKIAVLRGHAACMMEGKQAGVMH